MIFRFCLFFGLIFGGFYNAMGQTTIPFTLGNNHVYLQVSVNNSTPLSFILDTGAANSLIDLDKAKQLNLQQIGQIPVGGAGGDTTFGAILKDTNLTISGLKNFSVPVQVAYPLKSLSSYEGRNVDGVLGYEFFSNFVVQIDYEKKILTICDKDKFAYRGNGETIPLTFKMNHPHVTGKLVLDSGKEVEADFVVDIGSRFSLAMTREFVEKHNLSEQISPKIKTPIGVGIGGVTTGFIGRIKQFRLGKISLNSPLISLSNDEKGALATSQFFEGNIGAEILRKFKITFDYSRKKMILERTKATDSKQIYDQSGIHLLSENSQFKIYAFTENSPATAADLRVNDILDSIDGVSASQFSMDEIKQKFKKDGAIRLKVKRGEEILEKKIVLKKLI